MFYGLSAHILWGFFPAYFPLLAPAAPVEIVAHRIIWTLLVMLIFTAAIGGWQGIRAATRKDLAWLFLASLMIAVNWGVYVLAVNSGHVAQAALGYFINPLVSVALGVLVLKERLRPIQAIAIGIATIAVTYLTFAQGEVPIAALTIALSFALYGLIKKKISIPAVAQMTVETIVLFPIALAYWAYLAHTGASTFTGHGHVHSLLLISSGLITAVPLLLFNKAAQVLPLATLGIIQFLTPNIQAIWAFFVKHEPMPIANLITFGALWLAVALYLSDVVRLDRQRRSAEDANNDV